MLKLLLQRLARNKATKSALRTAVKKAYYAVDTNADNKTEAVRLAIKKIDQAAAKGILQQEHWQQEANHHLLKDLTHQHKCNKNLTGLKAENILCFFILFC